MTSNERFVEGDAASAGSRKAWGTRVALVLGALLSTVVVLDGCGMLAPKPPRQGWSERKYGPLVPHEGFPGDCSICHLPESWTNLRDDFSFDHEAQTGVALVGAHEKALCLRCHNDRGPVAEYQARGCGGCHADPHEATLGMDCERCHDSVTWTPTGMIAEHSRTRFPLVGVHAGVTCDRCHVQARVGIYEGLPVECAVCHQADLARALEPDHLTAGWVTDCQDCHTPSREWGGAGFSHANFPLTGAHARADCTLCHVGGVYSGTPRDCFACHEDDYLGATDPNHVTSMFPTSCERCHNTQGWDGANFDHNSFFPISSGPHSGLDCAECHLGSSFASFTCTECHAHRQADMANEHDEVNGYTYSSPACLACHPNGRE